MYYLYSSTKLVGTLPSFDKQSMIKYFRGLYITKVKDAISSYVVKKQISILEINAYIDELSSHMKERIAPEMDEYGIKLANFYVNDISVPEDDSAVKKLKDALAKKAEMNVIGYNYQQERSFDTLEGAANNTGSNAAPLMGAGIGLGMGVGLGGTMGSAFNGIVQNIATDGKFETKECPKCHSNMDTSQRFCGSCGFDTQDNSLNDQDTEELNRIITCSKCGSILSKGLKFCPECGKKYNPCPECGNDLYENATFCEKCGYEVPKTCPSCGNVLPKNSKFCPECGYSLVEKCSKCGHIYEGKPKFCPECGERLR